MARAYPRLGLEDRSAKSRPCVVCGARTNIVVDVQWTWMRGDDGVEHVCKEHRRRLHDIVQAIQRRAE